MNIRYTGTQGDGVVIVDQSTGREFLIRDEETGQASGIKPGDTIEVPDELAARLLEQDIWEAVDELTRAERKAIRDAEKAAAAENKTDDVPTDALEGDNQ